MDIQIGDNVIWNFFKVAFVLIRNQNSLNAAAMRRQVSPTSPAARK